MSLIHFNHHLPNFINHIHKLIILICFLNLEFNQINSLPLNNQINNLQENSNQINSNPLNQYLKEPEIVKIYKEKIVIKIFPLIKKDVQVNNYYVIVELIDGKLNPFINNSTINLTNPEEIDFSLNYFYSLRKGRSFYAAVKLTGQIFYSRRTYVTIIIGKHQIDLSRPREFRLEEYVNPFLSCGKHYRIGVAAELKTNNRKKEFIYVPYSRTIIMGENGNGQCEQIDTVALFFVLSFIALIISLISFCILLTYNTISTGNLYFWKKKKMNCKQLMKQNLCNKERLTLINHTNIYEEDDFAGDYDEISLSKSKAKNLDSKTNPIPISILYEYYNQMNSDHLFKKEYDSIPKGKLFNSKIATLKINQKKNRYLNLLPYDNNRVILDALPNETNFIQSKSFNLKSFKKDELDKLYLRPTDYINASYIDTYDHNNKLISKKYIATQGPLKHTIGDFWKMVYQTNCNQIVMLANVFEGGQIKCEKYWPELSQIQIYGQLSVRCREEHNFADYTIRVFRVKELNDDKDSLNNNNQSFKDVHHYHFKSWGDHSVPEYSDSIALLLNSIRTHWSYKNQKLNSTKNNNLNEPIKKMNSIPDEFELEDKHEANSSPIIVHCSAGIGRSGCFMVIDSLLEQANRIRENDGDFENYKIDVLKEFANIRKQRIQSIERISQYAFVHQVLVEMLSSRDIYDVEPQDYTKYYKMLKESSIKKLNEFKYITKLEEQFNILNKFKIQIDDDLKSVGMFNLKKNRNRQCIPKNTTRVLLPIIDDYINAVYLNGFKYLNEFIVTEVPLKEVRHLFWLMVNNENIDTIVLLNSIESHNYYWPTELNNPHIYKELEIELICEEKTTDYFVKRQFRINKKKLIYQLHYNHWDSICKRPSNLASYCLFMKSIQMHLNKNSAFPNQFIVQCNNGVTASGIYCITKHICDRLFAENRINVFLSSKYLRTNRMEFIESMEQYNFLFEYIQLITLSFYSKDYKFLNFTMNN